jgi:hypothetical protein
MSIEQRLVMFRGTCFTSHQGYWYVYLFCSSASSDRSHGRSYEVCAGRYVRQYHQEKGKIEAQNWLGRRYACDKQSRATELKRAV